MRTALPLSPGQPSTVNQLLVLNAPARLTPGTVLLLREAVGF
ncbi:hypothetical protein ACIRYZ_00375 [Kitasatospora sp. NPDC101155]